MAQRRKLQVFVSSTFTDLKVERQAAVESILTTGHIPAGMELFAGENEDQMNIIKRWIDESDIYLLILGGRYGSVEKISKKSYTHLEYDYAKETGKTVFVVVAADSYTEKKVTKKNPAKNVMELDHREQYLEFKNSLTGKFVKHWDSISTLQLAIINTLHVLDRDENLIGWVPGNESTNSGAIAEEIARLGKENADLRAQLAQIPKDTSTYNGLDFSETYEFLSRITLDMNKVKYVYQEPYILIAMHFGNYKDPALLHFFWTWSVFDKSSSFFSNSNYEERLLDQLVEFSLVEQNSGRGVTRGGAKSYAISESGIRFLLRMKLVIKLDEATDIFGRLQTEINENGFNPFTWPTRNEVD